MWHSWYPYDSFGLDFCTWVVLSFAVWFSNLAVRKQSLIWGVTMYWSLLIILCFIVGAALATQESWSNYNFAQDQSQNTDDEGFDFAHLWFLWHLLWLNAAYLSLRKFNLEKAQKMSYKCNELEPNNGTYQDTYAWILYQLGDYREAKKWLEKALNNGAGDSPIVVDTMVMCCINWA